MLNKESLEKFNKTSLDQLERKDLGINYNFAEIRLVFQRIFTLLKYLIDQDISLLPEQQKNIIQSNLDNFLQFADRVLKFDSKTQNIDQRNQLIQEIRDFENSLFHTLLPVFSYSKTSESSNKKIEKEAKDTLETIKIAKQGAAKALQGVKKEADKILKDARTLSAKIVVGKYSTIFENQAIGHRKEAKKWGIASIVFIVALGVGAFFFIKDFSSVNYLANGNMDWGAMVNNIFLKVIILSLGSVVIVQCIKNYNAQRHLHVISTHRRNALDSFDAINDQATDSVTRNALLLHVAKAIYDPGKTGYLSKGDVNVSGISALDFIKNFIGK